MNEGFDRELNIGTEEEKVMPFEKKEEKPKRRPFHYWEVRGKAHRLKLTTSAITMLERKYKRNVMNLLMDDGIPPLSIMLDVVQLALNTWEHGTSYNDVQKLFDAWIEDGGDQQSFYAKVIIPVMAVSGFFSQKQAAELMESVEESMGSL